MKEFKAYLLGTDGRTISRLILLCVDVNTAKERLLQLGFSVELLHDDHKIATAH